MSLLQTLIHDGIAHKGFAFIDVLQICATFFNMTDYYQSRVYELTGHDATDFEAACKKAREWDYNRDAPIALGRIYQRMLPTFDSHYPTRSITKEEREERITRLLKGSV